MKRVVLVICISLFFANFGLPEIKTFSQTVKLVMGERDSREQLRAQATLEAKRLALEEAGAYIQSVANVKQIFQETNTAYSEDYFKQVDLLALTAGVASVVVKNEEWKVEGPALVLYLTCEVTVDTKDIQNQIKSLLNDRQKYDSQKELQEENQRLRQDLEDLKRRLEKVEAAKVPELNQEKEKLTKQFTAQEWFNKGYAASNPEDKINFYTEAIHLDPDWSWPYNNRGIAYANKGDYDQAISDYNQALKLDPNYAQAYVNRGCAYADKGDYDQAISDYNQALKLDPNCAQAYGNRGNVYADKEDYDKAISDYNQALKLDPNDAQTYNNRGCAYALKGDYHRAREDFLKAKALGDSNAQKALDLLEK
jgi:tetratricopeptide (TPR) repeat protein